MTKSHTDILCIGVIGAGIGQAHVNGLSKVGGGQVAAICDINTERATQMAKASGLDVPIYGDYREMFDQANLDATTVGLPNALHKPVAIAALDAGLHVFCEKPLALSAQEGQEIADAAKRNGKNCMVGQVNRFRPDSQFLKKVIQSGDLGEIYYSHTGWLRTAGIPGYGGWFTTKSMSGGGPLIDIGVHMLDIAWWLCGAPRPIAVSGVTYAKFGPHGKGLSGWGVPNFETGIFDVEDLALAIIRFENGLTINLEVSWALGSRSNEQWCEIYGDKGGCEWGEKPGVFRDLFDTRVNSAPELPEDDAWRGQMQHFVDSILNGTKPDPDAEQGVAMMKMLDGIYASAAAGREITID